METGRWHRPAASVSSRKFVAGQLGPKITRIGNGEAYGAADAHRDLRVFLCRSLIGHLPKTLPDGQLCRTARNLI